MNVKPLMDGDHVTPRAALSALKAWMEHRLNEGPIETRGQHTGYAGAHVQSGYSAVLVPDWEMRQKLQLVTDALSNTSEGGLLFNE